MLIFDEIQTGVGRTGKLFAYEWSGITPDIMSVAKGIGGGFPMGACLATAEAAKGMTAGTHGSTFGGNPLAMAVGNAVLDVLLQDGFFEHVRQIGLKLKQKLAAVRTPVPSNSAHFTAAGSVLSAAGGGAGAGLRVAGARRCPAPTETPGSSVQRMTKAATRIRAV